VADSTHDCFAKRLGNNDWVDFRLPQWFDEVCVALWNDVQALNEWDETEEEQSCRVSGRITEPSGAAQE